MFVFLFVAIFRPVGTNASATGSEYEIKSADWGAREGHLYGRSSRRAGSTLSGDRADLLLLHRREDAEDGLARRPPEKSCCVQQVGGLHAERLHVDWTKEKEKRERAADQRIEASAMESTRGRGAGPTPDRDDEAGGRCSSHRHRQSRETPIRCDDDRRSADGGLVSLAICWPLLGEAAGPIAGASRLLASRCTARPSIGCSWVRVCSPLQVGQAGGEQLRQQKPPAVCVATDRSPQQRGPFGTPTTRPFRHTGYHGRQAGERECSQLVAVRLFSSPSRSACGSSADPSGSESGHGSDHGTTTGDVVVSHLRGPAGEERTTRVPPSTSRRAAGDGRRRRPAGASRGRRAPLTTLNTEEGGPADRREERHHHRSMTWSEMDTLGARSFW